MTIKALFTYDYGKERMDSIRELGYEVLVKNEKDVTYTEEFKAVEVLVCYNPFETLDISKMNKLKWIQLSSIGIDQVPKEKLMKSNIILTNNRGGYSIPMGEWIVLKILELYKNSKGFYEKQQNRKWKIDTSIMEVHGRTIGFLGTGTIAVEAAKRLQGFDIELIGLNTKGTPVEHFNKCFKREDIDEMLKICDVVVATIPYTKETHHLLNRERMAVMKEGSMIVNVARGAIIEEKALIENISTGKIKGAALDVVDEEPLDESSPLWSFENVIITPHNSWVSEKRNERRFDLIYKNMAEYVNSKELINVVDVTKGY